MASLPDPDMVQAELLRQSNGNGLDKKEETEDIPPIKKIHLDVVGTRGKRYVGDFVYKVPTLGDQVQIGNLKTRYAPTGLIADANAAAIVEQTCYLHVTLQEKPDWWKPFEFYDAAPVSALYAEAIEYERRFHGEAPKSRGVQEGAGEALHDDQADDSDDQLDVGRKVQPPSKRSEVIIAHTKGSR